MELISREELLKQIEMDSKGNGGQYGDEWLFIDTINSLPTVEEREEGRWIDHKRLIMTDPEIWGYSQECSICGFVLGAKEYNFCPNCGARMKGE